MSAYPPEFNRGVVRPFDCIRQGKDLVKDQYWLFLGIVFVGILLGSAVPLYLLLGPMMCGIYMCYLRRMRGESVSFDVLFKGFDYFTPSLVAALAQAIPIVIGIVIGYVGGFAIALAGAGIANESPEAGIAVFGLFFGFMMVVVLLASLVGLFFMFAFPLIVDRGLGGIDACKLSARAVVANLGGLFGLFVSLMLLGFLGMLACYVGVFFLMPISFGAIAVAYRQIFPDYGRPIGPQSFGQQPPIYGAPYGYPPAQ
jgi:uncharacterized membrane protein